MQWNDMLSADALHSYFHEMAKLDRATAHKSLDWYRVRTRAQLEAAAAQAWNANDREGYVLARSFAQLTTDAIRALRRGEPLHQIMRGII